MFRIVHKVNGYCPSERKKREEIILTASAQVLKLGPTYHTFLSEKILSFFPIKRENRVIENVFHNEESLKVNHYNHSFRDLLIRNISIR